MRSIKKWIGMAAAAGLLSTSATVANAAWVLEAEDIVPGANGTTASSPVNLDISTLPGNSTGPNVNIRATLNGNDVGFQRKDTPGGNTKAVGTNQTPVTGEIGTGDGTIANGEAITFSFDSPVFLSRITIAWLFPNGEYGDQGNEIATFFADGVKYELEATGKNSAVFRNGGGDILDTGGLGGITVLELALDGINDDGQSPSGGVFQLDAQSLFGNFTTLMLQGGNTNTGAAGSDFSFVSMEGASVVPVPAALPLLVTGLAALGLLRWRRRQTA